MLAPDYLERCADDIIDLYAQLDEAIIADITRRIIKTSRITKSAKWQIKQAQEMGLLYDDIIAEIGRRTDAAESHVRALFEDAGVKTVEFDNQIYRAAGLVPVNIRQSPAMLQVLNAGYKKTLGNIKNLTLTTANTSQNAYYNACNLAYMKITSGAFSYQEAIKEAIKQTARQGSTVLYPSGHIDKVDVAVRRAVLTGVGQTCRSVCETNAIEMGCDLMELSAHSGARPSHAVWQGQLVSLSGRKGYLTKDAIGYGTIEGFGGVNCLHDWFPYFEGISTRNYTEEALKQMNAKCFEYNGVKYSEYEISQIQRKLEREIRAAKREKVAYQVAVSESDGEFKGAMQEALKYSNSLVRDKQAKMRDFINQTGEQRQYFREQNYGKVAYNGLTTGQYNGKLKAGGKITDKNFMKADIFEKQAEKYYTERLNDNTDIAAIAKNTGFSENDIQRIKNHMMSDEILFKDGTSRRFDPDIDQALAWKRLIEGENIKSSDILLLNHELEELTVMETEGIAYEDAHNRANKKYNWEEEKEKFTDNDNLY